jgi:hypothetical protein
MKSQIRNILIINALLMIFPLGLSISRDEYMIGRALGGLGFLILGGVDLILFVFYAFRKEKRTSVISLIIGLVFLIIGTGVCTFH